MLKNALQVLKPHVTISTLKKKLVGKLKEKGKYILIHKLKDIACFWIKRIKPFFFFAFCREVVFFLYLVIILFIFFFIIRIGNIHLFIKLRKVSCGFFYLTNWMKILHDLEENINIHEHGLSGSVMYWDCSCSNLYDVQVVSNDTIYDLIEEQRFVFLFSRKHLHLFSILCFMVE